MLHVDFKKSPCPVSISMSMLNGSMSHVDFKKYPMLYHLFCSTRYWSLCCMSILRNGHAAVSNLRVKSSILVKSIG